MLKITVHALWSPVLTEMLVCKLPGYLLQGRELFVLAVWWSIKTQLTGQGIISKK